MQAMRYIGLSRALLIVSLVQCLSCSSTPEVDITDAEAQSIVDGVSRSYECAISSPSRMVIAGISHSPPLEEPIVTNTFFFSADGNECDKAIVELQDLGKERGIDFSRLITIPVELGEKEELESSNADLIHQIDPQDDT